MRAGAVPVVLSMFSSPRTPRPASAPLSHPLAGGSFSRSASPFPLRPLVYFVAEIPHSGDIAWRSSTSVRLLSRTINTLWVSRAVASGETAFFFTAEYYSVVETDLFFGRSIGGRSGCSRIVTVVSKAAVNPGGA